VRRSEAFHCLSLVNALKTDEKLYPIAVLLASATPEPTAHPTGMVRPREEAILAILAEGTGRSELSAVGVSLPPRLQAVLFENLDN